ncbi:MAG: sigma-54 dependent transcriptional regulator [Candidatus Omnitrophica bacterium]|nr:sigma-54 dependent transcriptional regulator [Candidatus Omnitrophota bacterium]
MAQTILIVEDNKDTRFLLSNILEAEGYAVTSAADGKSALAEAKNNLPDLVLLDINLPDLNGMKILDEMKKIDKDILIVMLTAYGNIKQAVKAMKQGAFHYVTKPFDNEELILTIKNAFKTRYLSREVENLKKRLGESTLIEQAMGQSPAIRQVLKQVEIAAPTNMTIIIQGASGTGKELIANMIHQKSLRKDCPFIPVDCGAIPESLAESELFGFEKGAFTGAEKQKEGKFEQANSGTLFLDEITNLPESVQVKLLRVIQERKLQHLGGKKYIKVDVRIIAATNINLQEAVKTSKFREDLFYRLNEFHIELPSLKKRKEDIPVLAEYFLREVNQELNRKVKKFSPEAMKILMDYYWPGNVRELKNAVKRAVLLAEQDDILPSGLYGTIASGTQAGPVSPEDGHILENIKTSTDKPFEMVMKEIEAQVIKEALLKASGNRIKAAEHLGMNRKTLYRKIKSLKL